MEEKQKTPESASLNNPTTEIDILLKQIIQKDLAVQDVTHQPESKPDPALDKTPLMNLKNVLLKADVAAGVTPEIKTPKTGLNSKNNVLQKPTVITVKPLLQENPPKDITLPESVMKLDELIELNRLKGTITHTQKTGEDT